MFAQMVDRIKSETVGALMRVQIASEEDVQALAPEEDIPLAYSGGDGGAPEPQPSAKAKRWGATIPAPAAAAKNTRSAAAARPGAPARGQAFPRPHRQRPARRCLTHKRHWRFTPGSK